MPSPATPPHRLAREALGFDLVLLAPPAIQHSVRNAEFPRLPEPPVDPIPA